MTDQGRLTKVMFALMTAMTVGSIVLLSLEGKPIKPMAFSLASEVQSPLNSVQTVLGTQVGLDMARWQQIEITYRANNGQLANDQLTGSLALAYHFVISDGTADIQDGKIFASHRWAKQLPCLNRTTESDAQNTIRICLIGDPDEPQCTPNQARQLELLADNLIRHCQCDLDIIWL